MHRVSPILLLAVAVLGLSGCEGHEAKVADLQSEYDRLAATFHQDCYQETLAKSMNPVSHPTLSQKCTNEDQQVAAAWKRLQEARTKK